MATIPESRSGMFSEVTYHARSRDMEVTFRSSGRTWRFADVPPQTYEAFTAAGSMNAYYQASIRGKFESVEI